MSVESVAAAVATLEPRPRSIEVLNGGVGHDAGVGDARRARAVSTRLLHDLRRALRAVLPLARVVLDLNATSTPDEDLLKMASAPSLVVGGGSFGIAGALAARRTSQVRTPETDTLYVLTSAPRTGPPRLVRPGWRTFEFEFRSVDEVLRWPPSERDQSEE